MDIFNSLKNRSVPLSNSTIPSKNNYNKSNNNYNDKININANNFSTFKKN